MNSKLNAPRIGTLRSKDFCIRKVIIGCVSPESTPCTFSMVGWRGYHAKIGARALLHFGPIASPWPSIDALVGDYDFAGEASFGGPACAAANGRSAATTNT